MASMVELIASGTTAASATLVCVGPTRFAITNGALSDAGETVTIKAEDADGNYNDEIYRFNMKDTSVLLELYCTVTVARTVTKTALTVAYGI